MPQDYNPKPEVDEKYPFFAPFWRHLTESVYNALFISDLEVCAGKSSKMAALLPDGSGQPSPLMLHLGTELLKKAYHDAWIECHVSDATGELDGLPEPESWEPETLEDVDALVRPYLPIAFIKHFITEMGAEIAEEKVRRYKPEFKPHLQSLIESVTWISDYANFANEHYGKVTPAMNRNIVEQLKNFWHAMEDLGCF